ncbi:hypothetical protein N836_28865 [Leptolyngbya sp. Heron Island J]|uniref:helix-turn-helix domain-containing protein n=1 Tax=Leptolyngbya sp. Heron Island J TaxID=1385935 RepID=UPI0003B95E53|nr:helix-turn-helix transcriptional regulator [Leptolyngbya sp. Heron Island J]ESA39090.1 hypothetical protein N836_28865 [Leptolyngbya sp. Heron Island J]
MNPREQRRLIGRNLKLRRLDLGFTKKAVADAAGVNIKTVTRIENGQSSLPLECAPSVVKFLDLGEDIQVLLSPLPRPWGKGVLNQD